MTPTAYPELTDRRWRGLYLAGGAGALLTALLIPLQVVVFIGWPPPIDGTVADWFATLQANPLHGLVSLDLLMMVEQVLVIAIVVALYVILHRASESLMAIAAVGWLVAATLFVASNTAFEMLSLSDGYAAATSEAARAPFLAAGQAMLASYWDQGTAFVFGYVMASVAGVIVGVAMLRSRAFGTAPAYAAIVANLLGLGIFVPGIGIALSLLSVVVLWVWYALVGVRLVRLGRSVPIVAVPSLGSPEPQPAAG